MQLKAHGNAVNRVLAILGWDGSIWGSFSFGAVLTRAKLVDLTLFLLGDADSTNNALAPHRFPLMAQLLIIAKNGLA